LNLGLHYLSGAISFDPVVTKVDPKLASDIVWLDCLLMNVDRTAKNTNMLCWQKELWLIDHGAALYFHHAWENLEQQALRPFTYVKDHVLLPMASALDETDKLFRKILTPVLVESIVSLIPDDWLRRESFFSSIEQHRQAYVQFLNIRIANSAIFVKEAIHAREGII